MADLIPEDLKGQYEAHKRWLAQHWLERTRCTLSVEAVLRNDYINLADRIARQDAELAVLREENARVNKDRREKSAIITHWQDVCGQLASIFGCLSLDDAVIEYAKKTKADNNCLREQVESLTQALNIAANELSSWGTETISEIVIRLEAQSEAART